MACLIDGNGGVDGIADELPEGHAQAVPIEDAVFVGLGEFLGEGHAGPILIRAAVLDHDPVVIRVAFQGLHLAGLGRELQPVVAAEDDGIQLGPKQDVDACLLPLPNCPMRVRAVVVGQSLAGRSQEGKALDGADAGIFNFQVGCHLWSFLSIQ